MVRWGCWFWFWAYISMSLPSVCRRLSSLRRTPRRRSSAARAPTGGKRKQKHWKIKTMINSFVLTFSATRKQRRRRGGEEDSANSHLITMNNWATESYSGCARRRRNSERQVWNTFFYCLSHCFFIGLNFDDTRNRSGNASRATPTHKMIRYVANEFCMYFLCAFCSIFYCRCGNLHENSTCLEFQWRADTERRMHSLAKRTRSVPRNAWINIKQIFIYSFLYVFIISISFRVIVWAGRRPCGPCTARNV